MSVGLDSVCRRSSARSSSCPARADDVRRSSWRRPMSGWPPPFRGVRRRRGRGARGRAAGRPRSVARCVAACGGFGTAFGRAGASRGFGRRLARALARRLRRRAGPLPCGGRAWRAASAFAVGRAGFRAVGAGLGAGPPGGLRASGLAGGRLARRLCRASCVVLSFSCHVPAPVPAG